jgi:uncharacterized membrane protein
VSDATSTPPQRNIGPIEGNKTTAAGDSAPKRGDVAIISPTKLEEILLQTLRPMLRPDQLQNLRVSVNQAVVQTSTSFHGPVPPPDHFRDYDVVLPGSADRILAMAEKEQAHRHGWERSHLKWDGVCNVAGLTFGWLLSICLAAGAVYCASINQPWVAVALTGVSAFGGVASLIKGRRLFGRADHQMPATSTEIVKSDNRPTSAKGKRGRRR